MKLSDSARAAVSVLRNRPSDLLPVYLLGAAIPAIVRAIPFLAMGLALVYLQVTGRLAAIRDVLATQELDQPPADADPEAFDEWASGFEPIVDQLLTAPMAVLVVVTVLVSILAALVLYGIVAAAQQSACYGRLRDEHGLVAGLSGARQYWLQFLGLYLLEIVLWLVVFGVLGLVSIVAALIIGPFVVLVFVPLFLLALVAILAIRAVFAFAPVAIVVDDVGLITAVRNATGFVRAHPIAATFYYVVAVGSLFSLSTVAGLLTLVEVTALVPFVSSLVLFPLLDLLKTALYTDGRGRLAPPAPVDRSVRRQFADGVGRGWGEMVSFVRSTPGTHAAVVALGLGSFWIGWVLAAPLVGVVETSISARIDGIIPPSAAIEFFANNWLVAITTAFAGVVFAVPALVSLVFNGLVMGLFARTEVEPAELAAFVAPHGIFEIPAIFIASALGVSLGVLTARVWTGDRELTDLADGFERAFWVLIGVGILLAIAGFVEGFISPFYFRLFL